MTMKQCTKGTVLFVLVSLTCVPLYAWVFSTRSLEGVAGFVIACTGPLGVLIGGLAAKSITAHREEANGNR